jgi:hypothetical protein
MLDSTFLETRLAVGRLGYIRGYGSVRPTRILLSAALDRDDISQRNISQRTGYGNRYNNEQIDVKKLQRTINHQSQRHNHKSLPESLLETKQTSKAG